MLVEKYNNTNNNEIAVVVCEHNKGRKDVYVIEVDKNNHFIQKLGVYVAWNNKELIKRLAVYEYYFEASFYCRDDVKLSKNIMDMFYFTVLNNEDHTRMMCEKKYADLYLGTAA